MRSIFCGNFEYDARQSDVERLFRRHGKVNRIDMKSGFAFVFMEDDRDADDAIHALDQIEFGRNGRRLRVEWTKHERSNKRPESTGRSSSNLKPSKTLFVINFDPYRTRTRDLERHFDRYGKILNVRIRKNFAFVQFESQEDATRALDATNMSKLFDRVISVEYAVKDDDDRRNGYSPARGRGNSPRRGYDRVRSPSPHRRERDSPDYGHGRGPRGRSRSRSPHRSEGASPDYEHGSSPSPRKERHPDYNQSRSPSPTKDRNSESDSDHRHNRSRSPSRESSNGDNGRGSIPRKESPGYGRGPGSTPKRDEHEEKAMNPGDCTRNRSPAYSDAEMPLCEHEYGSQSPWAQESS